MNYYIVQPTFAGHGKIVAICTDKPAVCAPLLAVKASKGYVLLPLGSELPYRMCLGSYEEVEIDTAKEGT